MKLEYRDQDGSLTDIRQALKGYEDQIPLAVAQTLTFTAERIQGDLKEEMKRVFDNPKPFTVNSVGITSAKPKRLFATVFLKDKISTGTPASDYLKPQIEGGGRSQKALEGALRAKGLIGANQFMIPGDDVRLNRYGNITRRSIDKALTSVMAPRTQTKQQTGKRSRDHFWIPDNGIFWRTGKKTIKSFMIVAGHARYKERFKFYNVAEKSAAKHLPEQFDRSIKRVIRKAEERGRVIQLGSGRG